MSLEKALQENTEVMRELIAVLGASGGAAALAATPTAKGDAPAEEEKETKPKATRGRSRSNNTAEEKDESPKYTAEHVKAAAVKVKDELGTPTAKKLIKKHGAPELAKLKAEVYADFIADAEKLISGEDVFDEDEGEDEDL